MSPSSLELARDEARFGGKAVALGASLRAGLPVPGGWALDDGLACAVASGEARAQAACAELFGHAGGSAFAVRSSAVGEDSQHASFAGQHLTRLHVRGRAALLDAIREVWESGRTAAALAYRRRLGLSDEVRMGVVVQRMVAPSAAGVLFTRNPVTGADERVIEATWGLGEAVVSGLVTPDRYRLQRGGAVLECLLGEKDLEIVPDDGGGTSERAVDASRAAIPCLDAAHLASLESLAERCERAFVGASDLEFAFEGRQLFLLQRRAVTR